MDQIKERISNTGLVPVVVIDDASKAVVTAYALLKGGVDVMEITMRTAAGMEAIRLVSDSYPDMLVGAGTVLTLEHCKQAVQNGAKFIVSPGYDPEIVEYCIENNILICPGCVTPTEISAALKKGLNVLKFFPANIYGGLKAIKALSGPFPNLKFIPTGGVDLSNLADFINPVIFAIGGGWLCTREDINNDRFDTITDICSQSIDVLLAMRDDKGNPVTLNTLLSQGGKVTTGKLSLPRVASQLTRRGFQTQGSGNNLLFVKENITIDVTAQ